MRHLQHAKLAASGLPADEPGRKEAKATIVTEVEQLHWRIWNGKAKNAQKTFDRIRKVMHLYKSERGHRTRGVASRKLWHALHEIDKYLRSQSARLVNYAARYRAGMRVGTSVTEGTANFLVNRRMNKSQQMRWSRQRGADLLLQVRCAVYNEDALDPASRSTVRTHRPSKCNIAIAALSHQFSDSPAGTLIQLEQQLVRQRADLTHIDATMRLFDPDIKPNEILPKQRRSTWLLGSVTVSVVSADLR